MSRFTQDNINFDIADNFKDDNNGNKIEKRQVINGKLTSAANDYSGYSPNNTSSFLINCVDIDWNSAKLPNGSIDNQNNATIETTGQLLLLINNMAIKIREMETQINELSNQLN